jgi:hypothetical protein
VTRHGRDGTETVGTEALDRRVHTAKANVRDFAAMQVLIRQASRSSGRSTSCSATPASASSAAPNPTLCRRSNDVVGVNLIGVYVATQDMIDRGRAARSY